MGYHYQTKLTSRLLPLLWPTLYLPLPSGINDQSPSVWQLGKDFMSFPPAMTETSDLFQTRFTSLLWVNFVLKGKPHLSSERWAMPFLYIFRWSLQIRSWLQKGKKSDPGKIRLAQKNYVQILPWGIKNKQVQCNENLLFRRVLVFNILTVFYSLYPLCVCMLCFLQQATLDGQSNYSQGDQFWWRSRRK